jgi:uncharacterized protein
MGSPPEGLRRVVLDTNTLVSALLFSGLPSCLVPLWQSRQILPLVSRPVLQEYLRVLAYPKFDLSRSEIRGLLDEEFLPFADVVLATRRLAVVRDQEDNKFLECGLAGGATHVITGDKDLLILDPFRGIRILTPRQFLDQHR